MKHLLTKESIHIQLKITHTHFTALRTVTTTTIQAAVVVWRSSFLA
jgi:hypothetical protein